MPAKTFKAYLENSKRIFDSFPNESVWQQGGLKPNRQLQKPEAGYCVVLRYDAHTTEAIARFMIGLGDNLPPSLEYSQEKLHTTIGTYGKGEMGAFTVEPAILAGLMKSVEMGIRERSQHMRLEFGKWLFNEEALFVSGYPNRALWQLFQRIGNACLENGYALEMAQMAHITIVRFTRGVARPEFERFAQLVRSAPVLEPAKPVTIDLATWRCDGRVFELAVHRRYRL